MARRRNSLTEMVLHPWATLRRVQGLDRLPDRRVSRHPQRPTDRADPIGANNGRNNSIHKALGAYALDETRIELYENFREMDTDPMVSKVLTAFGQDGAQLDPDHKRVVWCEAKNSNVQRIVTETLDRLGIDRKAFPIMRSMSRDGDVFFHLASARGQGVVAWRAYDPWNVARIEDEIGRLIGFAPADERGEARAKETNAAQFYQVAHFRLPQNDLTEKYGAFSSFLHGSRVIWRELQLMEDQVVIQRLLRRPDRVMVLLETTGMSADDAWATCKDWERRMYREPYLNPAAGMFMSQGLPLDLSKDFVLPKGEGNNTQIVNFPATATNDILKDIDMFLARFAAGIGFPLGFIGRGDSNSYQPGQSLSRQSTMFAKNATLLQRAFLDEIVRICMIDLAYKGLNAYDAANAFTLNMASVAPIVEIERAEVIQLKMDRMERALAFGTNAQLDMNLWTPWVLEKYGGLPSDVISKMFRGTSQQVPPGSLPEPMSPPAMPPQPPTMATGERYDVKTVLREVEGALTQLVPIFDPVPFSESRTVDVGGELASGRTMLMPTGKIDESTGRGTPHEKLHEGIVFPEAAFKKAVDKRAEVAKARREVRLGITRAMAGG